MPYCEAEQDICHDGGYGYDEVFSTSRNAATAKTFTFQTMVSYVYEVSRSDCLNGGDHELQPVMHRSVFNTPVGQVRELRIWATWRVVPTN